MGLIIKALNPAYGGYSIGRIDDKVIFIDGAIPGELVEIDIIKSKKNFSFGKVAEILEPSPSRRAPLCPHFNICGGCQLQHINSEEQIRIKDDIIFDSLKRIGKVEPALKSALTDSCWGYRNRVQFKISPSRRIGFFKKSTRDIVEIDKCLLVMDEINALLNKLKENDLTGNLSDMHLTFGDSAVAFINGKNFDKKMINRLLESGFAGIAWGENNTRGNPGTCFILRGLKYYVSPSTFIQSHWLLNLQLVDEVINISMPLKGKRVLDLYSGAGNFSLPIALHAGEVTAVEENMTAVEDGLRNKKLNDIKNCSFINSSAEKYNIKDSFDLIILDPPRKGLTPQTSDKILKSPAEEIIYVSCDPATFARDLKILSRKYEIKSVRQINFFPQTYHIEAMALLALR